MLLPLRPLLASRISAVPLLCRASAEFLKGFVEADLVEVVDALFEPPVLDVDDELDEDEPDDELEALLDVDCGAVGWKRLWPAPNPILGA